jgi:putative heme iron utilization protein
VSPAPSSLPDDPAAAARRLMRGARSAALATALDEAGGWAYVTLVTTACDCDGSPILLLSTLADHTQNLETDARASLLFEAASGRSNPQTGARVTVLGRIGKSGEDRHGRRFLARHPGARLYAGFGDFHFQRMAVERARYVGGFGAAAWIEGADLVLDPVAAAAVATAEPAILEHMNGDHAEVVDLYANRLLGRRGSGWILAGVDPEGADLKRRGTFVRLDYAKAANDADACRTELMRLAVEARAKD